MRGTAWRSRRYCVRHSSPSTTRRSRGSPGPPGLHALGEREPREPEAQLVGEQDDVVRLMTIHQAKGLEFPVVVLVDLGRRLERDNDTAVIDEELGVLVAPVAGAGLHPQSQAQLEA